MRRLVVIGYDGADEAGHANDAAATILRATDAVVVSIRSSLMRRGGVGGTTAPE